MTVALIARLVLAGLFAVAGFAKLADRPGTRKTVVAFGAPERIAPALAFGLPLAELTAVGLLLPASTAAYGALCALGLLALFTAAIALGLARGRKPDCHCFGQLHSAPTSWKTLARNAALLALAALALAGSIVVEPPSAVAWIGALEGAELLAFVVAAAATVLLAVGALAFLSLLRSYGIALTRLDRVETALARAGLELEGDVAMRELGLPPGEAVPAFTARSLAGEEVTNEMLRREGVPTLLVFTSTTCGPCSALLPAVAEWQREYSERLRIVVASAGPADAVRSEADEHGLGSVLHDEDSRLYQLFEANGTPSAVLVAPDGTIGSFVASGREWIEHLLDHALEGADGEGLPVGADAPALELHSLERESVRLESLRGRDTLLLFWNPECRVASPVAAGADAVLELAGGELPVQR
jgi:peroxiredoxin